MYRVLRGGCYRDRPGSVLLSHPARTDAGGLAPTSSQDYTGFRVFREED